MSDLIVPVAEIQEINPHPNADALELAQVLGWQTVVPKGQYQAGMKVVYFPPDTVLPQDVSDRFGVTQYLSKQRIRCTRLRGEPSFGLVVLPDHEGWPVGENVASYYGATKWKPPVRTWRSGSRTAGKDRGFEDSLPEPAEFWRYTNIQNMRHFPDLFQPGEEVVVSEKLHGTNSRVAMIEGTLMAGSHRVRRKEPEFGDVLSDLYWRPLALPGVLRLLDDFGIAHKQVILYGEIFGPGIQSFHYGAPEGHWGYRAFDLLVDGQYLDADRFAEVCCKYGIKTVPILGVVPYDLARIRAMSEGKTTLIENQEKAHIREGVVVRPLNERTNPKVGRLVLKYVSDDYLLDRKRSDFTEM